MTFGSILFPEPADLPDDVGAPEYFRDLNLDQVVAPMLAGREQHDLASVFHAPLHDAEAVRFRQAVSRDLEDERVRSAIDRFADGMALVRRRRNHALRLEHRNHRFRWFREAARVYCETVETLHEGLNEVDPASQALQALRDYLMAYTTSRHFRALADDGVAIDEELDAVRYTVQIDGDHVTVRSYEGGDDYRHDVEETFSKFERGEAKDRRVEYPALSGLNRVEAQVLDLVAELSPVPFGRLADYCTVNADFIDARIARFDREVQFYLAWLDFIAPMRSSGLRFTYPAVAVGSKEARVVGSFDIALAAKSTRRGGAIVPNDFSLNGDERILVVTGPNQGGKTTFARMFGQLHHLSALGLPVPGESVRLALADRIYTVFEREEKIESMRGKLVDELVRIRDMLDQATVDSVVVVNEGFTSTTLLDAGFLGGEVLRRLIERDLLGVYVTFVDELASLGEATVSMVATVDADDPEHRTLRVVRGPADGLAYAAALAGRYGVSYDMLKKRIIS